MQAMKIITPLSLIFSLLLVGCAVTSTIENDTGKSSFDGAVYSGKTSEINPDIPGMTRHRIFHQGATGFVSIESIREEALERATSFCALEAGRVYLIEETTSTPPFILGNWPRIEIVFGCKNKKDAAQSPTSQSDRYDQLAKLKTLLDSGAMTEEEYQVEKAKLLSNK